MKDVGRRKNIKKKITLKTDENYRNISVIIDTTLYLKKKIMKVMAKAYHLDGCYVVIQSHPWANSKVNTQDQTMQNLMKCASSR